MALDATTGGASADSYISEADADTYHGNNLNVTDWTGAPSSDKEKALKMATRLLDERIDWNGSKYTEAQSLRWPRSNVTDPDGYAVGTDEIPTAVTNATAEFAKFLIAGNRVDDSDGKGISRVKAGSVEVDFDKTDTADVLPEIVYEMLRGWGTIHTRSKFGAVAVVRT